MQDYRDSHKDPEKGANYHAKFSQNAYRAMIWEMERCVLDEVVRDRMPKGFSHLDFACGTGRVLEHISPKAGSCVGVDVSESMLAVARSNLAQCELITADITRDAVLSGRRFDLITAFRFFPNAQDDLRKEAIASLASLLAPDGVLVFNNHKNAQSLIYTIGRMVGRRDRVMSAAEVSALVESAGLRVDAVRHMGSVPATERYRVLPISVMKFVERLLSRAAWTRRFAFNHVYICSRPASGAL